MLAICQESCMWLECPQALLFAHNRDSEFSGKCSLLQVQEWYKTCSMYSVLDELTRQADQARELIHDMHC